jgi:hypothetical protein
MVKVCINGLLMSKAGIGDDESSILSVYEYVADDDDILKAYRSLGIDPYYRIKCKCVICLITGIIFTVSLNI